MGKLILRVPVLMLWIALFVAYLMGEFEVNRMMGILFFLLITLDQIIDIMRILVNKT